MPATGPETKPAQDALAMSLRTNGQQRVDTHQLAGHQSSGHQSTGHIPINQWPASERPREKLIRFGAHTLSDAELLAIFLRTGVNGQSAVDLARKLLSDFKGLRPLLEAGREQFCAANGLGDAKYAQLQAVLEMARRHLAEVLTRDTSLTSTSTVKKYLMTQLRHKPREVFAALFLDAQHRLLAYEELFYGTVNEAAVYPREIVKKALEHNAAAVIMAHNHPSGVAEPSHSDKRITDEIKNGLGLMGICTLDHIVIGEGDPYSFAEHGLL